MTGFHTVSLPLTPVAGHSRQSDAPVEPRMAIPAYLVGVTRQTSAPRPGGSTMQEDG